MASKNSKKSVDEKIAEYWKKHRFELKQKMISINKDLLVMQRDRGWTDRQLGNRLRKMFVENVKQRISVGGLTVKKAIKSELNSRAYKTQAEQYQEFIMANIKKEPRAGRQVRRFFRDSRGRFVKVQPPTYLGKVEINGTKYSCYSFTNKITGKNMFFYQSRYPKAENYSAFLSEEYYG